MQLPTVQTTGYSCWPLAPGCRLQSPPLPRANHYSQPASTPPGPSPPNRTTPPIPQHACGLLPACLLRSSSSVRRCCAHQPVQPWHNTAPWAPLCPTWHPSQCPPLAKTNATHTIRAARHLGPAQGRGPHSQSLLAARTRTRGPQAAARPATRRTRRRPCIRTAPPLLLVEALAQAQLAVVLPLAWGIQTLPAPTPTPTTPPPPPTTSSRLQLLLGWAP